MSELTDFRCKNCGKGFLLRDIIYDEYDNAKVIYDCKSCDWHREIYP